MFSLLEILGEQTPTISVLDVGAMSFGFQTECYSALQKIGKCKVIGFEPIVEECEKLAQSYKDGRFLPYLLGDGSSKKFYTTNTLMTSSIFPPAKEIMGAFENLLELVTVVDECVTETKKLDDLLDIIDSVDYMKIDTQGAELEILKHGRKALSSSVFVHVEVEFVQIYENQPLFADVDAFLREERFCFHRFEGISGRRYKTFKESIDINERQQLWADAVYFKSLSDVPKNDLLKFALIAHEVYQSFDLCHLALSRFDAESDSDLAARYEKRLHEQIRNHGVSGSEQGPDRSNGPDRSSIIAPESLESDPRKIFHSPHYARHNHRRLEHLASLDLPLSGKSVLELGAGVGDHTSFFLDRGCDVTITEARESNLQAIKERYPDKRSFHLDLENPPADFREVFDIVYAYGILYHVSSPEKALEFMASCCGEMLLLETCVDYSAQGEINNLNENVADASQSVSGLGCRPSRAWLFAKLRSLFPHVYLPATQPCHEEFPVQWTGPPSSNLNSLHRAIFIGSRKRLWNSRLLSHLPKKQRRSS